MHAFMPARQYRSGHLPRRIMAALLCALLLLTSLSFLAEPAVLASDTRVFSRTLTDADGNRILVQVRCGADTGIPADAVLQVEELTDASASYDAYLEQTEAVLSFGAVGFARFFDITLTSPDDPAVQYQPAEGTVVEVRLQLGDVPLSDPHVIHFAKQAPPEVLENTVDGDLLQFETSGFSVYAIVDAPTSDDLALIARGVEELDGARVMLSIANGSNTCFFKNNLTTHRNFSVIERTNGTAAGAQNAAYYTFEKVAGTSDQFYIYTVDATGARQYILMTAPSGDNDPVTFYESGGTPFHVELFNNQPGAFYIYKQEGDKKWALNLHSGVGGKGFMGWSDNGNGTDNGAKITAWYALTEGDDPFHLNQKTYGIVLYKASNRTAIELTNRENPAGTVPTGDTITAKEYAIGNNPIAEGSKVFFTDSTEVTKWTFHNLGGRRYYITTVVDGVRKYLRTAENSATLADTPDDYCEFTAQEGASARKGCYRFLSKGGYALNLHSGKTVNGFTGYNDSGANEWVRLAELTDLTQEDFVTYQAHKVSVSDTQQLMERGAGASNLHMRFNLAAASNGQLLLGKKISGTDKQDYTTACFPYQIWYYDETEECWFTVARSETAEGYQYTGVSYVNYENTTTPVNYEDRFNGYDHVFFLRPNQVADIQFPSDKIKYKITECGVNPDIYDAVSVNDIALTGVENGTAYDYTTEEEVIGQRKVANFDNHVSENALRTLTISKKLFDYKGDPLYYPEDPIGFISVKTKTENPSITALTITL